MANKTYETRVTVDEYGCVIKTEFIYKDEAKDQSTNQSEEEES